MFDGVVNFSSRSLRGVLLGGMLAGISSSPIVAQDRTPPSRDHTPQPPATVSAAAPTPPPHWQQLRDRPLASNEIRRVFVSPAQPSGQGKDWGWWYTFITPAAPDGYAIADFGYELTGRIGLRDCHSWGECEVLSKDSSTITIRWRTQRQEQTFWYSSSSTITAAIAGVQPVQASVMIVVIYQKTSGL